MRTMAREGGLGRRRVAFERPRRKTVALIGAGRIGRHFAAMAGFRMRVIAYDPHVDAGTLKALGIEQAGTLDEGLANRRCGFDSLRAQRRDAPFDRRTRNRSDEIKRGFDQRLARRHRR